MPTYGSLGLAAVGWGRAAGARGQAGVGGRWLVAIETCHISRRRPVQLTTTASSPCSLASTLQIAVLFSQSMGTHLDAPVEEV